MAKAPRQRMAFDLPEQYMRAIRARAGFDGVNPSEVVMAAIDRYLPEELAAAAARMAQSGPDRPRGKGRKDAD